MASVPNSIKEAMLQIKLGNAALILELISRLHYLAGDSFTFESLVGGAEVEYIDISKGLIRRGLALLVEHKLITVEQIPQNGRGRPTNRYTALSWGTLAFRLGIELKDNEHCDAVTDGSFSSLKNYRKAVFYSFIKARPGKYSRRFLGQRLGVGRRSTWNYQKDTDIKVIYTWDEEELNGTSLKYAPKTKQDGKFFIKSYELSSDAVKVLPYTEFIVQRELRLGKRVVLTWQGTNEYKVA